MILGSLDLREPEEVSEVEQRRTVAPTSVKTDT